jgi:serine/threonine protein kinase
MSPGSLLARRYRLRELIGDGGMGRVWLAHDQVLCRSVAMKEIAPPQGLPGDQPQRLLELTYREARAVAQVDHPNVVKIYDIIDSGPWPWLVMQYVPSRSLRDAIRAEGPLAVAYVARIGLSVLDALLATHRAGVLHRDVTPRNVLIGHDGRVMLTDFGLALWHHGDEPSELGQSVVMGTAHYVAPERIVAGESTPAGDLWSLGATLYTAVEGRPPYARPSVIETLSAAVTQAPDVPSRAAELAPLLRGLLQREPRSRPTATEARAFLQDVAVGSVAGIAGTAARTWTGRLASAA